MDEPKLPPDESLSLHMEGVERDAGDMRIAAFIEKVDALRGSLQEVDKQLSGVGKPTLDYVVSELSHKSPAAVTLRTASLGISVAHQSDVNPTLCKILASAKGGGLRTMGLSHDLLEKILKLAEGSGDKFKSMWVSWRGQNVATISEETVAAVRELLAKKLFSRGSVKGRVEWYNSHNKIKHFYLYPALGERVRCVFGDELLTEASAAVEKSVIVSGTLSYWEGDFFPHEVKVSEIEVLALDDDLSNLASLSGAAPNATGVQSVSDFLRSRRDGWH